jgi:hypothetical protein
MTETGGGSGFCLPFTGAMTGYNLYRQQAQSEGREFSENPESSRLILLMICVFDDKRAFINVHGGEPVCGNPTLKPIARVTENDEEPFL